jgi:hypothetical protein
MQRLDFSSRANITALVHPRLDQQPRLAKEDKDVEESELI